MQRKVFVVCDNLRSLYNVGSIFRTSDALGVEKIYLCGITGTPQQLGVIKVALGAEKSVPWEHCQNAWQLVDRLKKQRINIVSLELTDESKNVKFFKPRFPLALIVGNEIKGVSPSLLKRSDTIIHIPMKGIKESLNVAVAFGIAVYEILNK